MLSLLKFLQEKINNIYNFFSRQYLNKLSMKYQSLRNLIKIDAFGKKYACHNDHLITFSEET